jgi:hypothetical protein
MMDQFFSNIELSSLKNRNDKYVSVRDIELILSFI